MVPLSQFYPKLMPRVIGCPQPIADQAIRDACIFFCEQSLVVMETLDPVTTEVGESTYDVPLASGVSVATVVRAWYNGVPLTPMPVHSVYIANDQSGTPLYFHGRDHEEGFGIVLSPIPDVAGELVLRVGLKPSRDATQVHTSLFNDWADAISDGAASLIKAIPEQHFTDLQMASILAQSFQAQAKRAKIAGINGKAQASLSIMMRRF